MEQPQTGDAGHQVQLAWPCVPRHDREERRAIGRQDNVIFGEQLGRQVVLRDIEADGSVGGHRALSDWLPSQRRQDEDAALTSRVERLVLARLSTFTGETLARGEFAASALDIEAFLASPASLPVRSLWLGKVGQGMASVVMVAKSAELKTPKRTSLPSMLPSSAATPRDWWMGLPAASAFQATSAPATNRTVIALQTAQP